MSCPFTVDDGAYVLGALSPAERAAFEQHLGTCPACREAVANVAVIPGLLGRLDGSVAVATTAPAAPAPAGLLHGVLAVARAEREAQRRRARAARLRLVSAACVAAILLATAVGVAVNALDDRSASVALTPMAPVSAVAPVTAEIGLTEVAGGSRIAMTCRYSTSREGEWLLRLVVFAHSQTDGDQVATWTATTGAELSLTATTHLAPGEISRVELQRADRTPLLVWSP